MDLHNIVGTSIRTTLLASSAITDLVGQRVFQVAAPANTQLPYITFWWTGGGFLNDNPKMGFDTLFNVVGVAENAGSAQAISTAIANALINITIDYASPWKSWANVTIGDMFHDMSSVQNEQYWRYGAQYRFRGSQ